MVFEVSIRRLCKIKHLTPALSPSDAEREKNKMKPQYELNGSVSEDKQVLDILSGFERLRRMEAHRDFAAIARKGQNRVFLNAGGMGGELKSQVHRASFHYWGQRLGYQCWDDPQFVREYLRDNDYARVKSKPRTVTVTNIFQSRRKINFQPGTLKLAA